MKRLNITTILGANVTDMDALIKFNLTSILDDLNWTALFKGNFTALMDSLNITSILGVNVTDIDALLHFNLTSLIKNLNWTDVLKDSIDALIDSLNKTSPFKYNLTEFFSLLMHNLYFFNNTVPILIVSFKFPEIIPNIKFFFSFSS